MNESTLTGLKVIVEKAVRPVRASVSCKRKMREELLAHVSAVFEEELARLDEEQAALERAAQRFGDPGERTVRLQESVPARDAVDRFADWLWFRPGESTFRRAVRHAMLIGGLGLSLFLLIIWYVLWKHGSEWPEEALWLGGRILLAVGYMMFGFTFLADWMRRAVYGPAGYSRRTFALVVVAAFGLLVPFLGLAYLREGSRLSLVDVSSSIVMTITFVVWLTGASVAIAHETAARMHYHEEWARLPIEPSS